MIKNISILVIVTAITVSGYLIFPTFSPKERHNLMAKSPNERFAYLSQNGNSACSPSFKNSIAAMPNDEYIIGSCCTKMSMHRYQEQIEGLKKYHNISEIPSDPYYIDAGLAKKMIEYYDIQLTDEGMEAYNYAMENSHEKGPCCCKCWRWYVYGGLGKYLIKEHKFTGEQLTEVWNLSDGCGGDEDHDGHG